MTLSDMALKLEEASKNGEKGSALFHAESPEKAQSAADPFDVDQGIAIIDSLTEFDYGEQINRLLANAAVAFKNFDYDTVLKIISKITAI